MRSLQNRLHAITDRITLLLAEMQAQGMEGSTDADHAAAAKSLIKSTRSKPNSRRS
jgi:hypothetical protein